MKLKYRVAYTARTQDLDRSMVVDIYFPAVHESSIRLVLTPDDVMRSTIRQWSIQDVVDAKVKELALKYYESYKKVPDPNIHPDWAIPGGEHRSFLEVEVDFGAIEEPKKSVDSTEQLTPGEMMSTLDRILGSIVVDSRMPADRVILVSFATKAGGEGKVLIDGVQIVGLYNR